MEVVGVIAAVPELVKLVQHVATAAGQITSGARMAKVVGASQPQLEVLGQILSNIQQRNERSLLGRGLGTRLAPVLRDVQTEIDGLQRLISKVNGSNGHSGVLKRAHLVLGGLEKQFKEHLRRIESTTSILQLYLAESTIQFSQKSHLSKILRPSTLDFIPEKLDGTAEWLWAHDTFNHWMGCREEAIASSSTRMTAVDDDSDRILSVYGVKGSGKSVLASSVAQELKKRGHVALFFSFWAGNDETRRSNSMLKCLLWQLLNTLSEDEQNLHIPRLLENHAELTKPSSICLELGKLCEFHRQSVYIVLDGIDESVDDWNDLKSGPLANLQDLVENNSNVRLLLTGRQSSLRSALSKWHRSIEITKALVGEDLNKLIAFELDNCPNLTDQAVRERVRIDLESRSSVMFLWIKLVFKQLRQSFCLHEIDSTLHRSPNELNREYARLFAMLIGRLDGHPKAPSVGMIRAKRLLCLIIGASRPLTVTELSQAYAYSFSTTTPTGIEIESYAVTQEAIIHACGDIVTVQDDLVYFGHASIREFLLRPPNQWESDDENVQFFCLDQRECQRLLAFACLRYLIDIEWRRKDNTQSLDELTEKYPLLHYASSYTMSHILSSDPQFEQTSGLVEGFLNSTDIFNWMEYVFSVDNGSEAKVPPLPLEFWDDLLHFLLAWDTLVGPKTRLPDTIATGLLDQLSSRHEQQNDSRGACINLMGLGSTNFPAPQGYVERWYDFVMEEPDKRLPLDTHKLHGLVKQMALNPKLHKITQVQLIGSKVGTCLMHVKALANPLDILFPALEKSLKGLSFLSLMAYGHLTYRSRPKQALKIFMMAAEKVHNKKDLKEAWALARVGDCLRCHDEIQDEERAERYYHRCMDILAQSQQNPLVTLGWCSAARCRVDCMLGVDRIDEAKELTKILESRLLSIQVPVQNPKLLSNWSYSMIWSSATMTRKRIDEALCLGNIYNFYGLNEEIERLMLPVTQGKSYTKCMGNLPLFKSMNLLALATDSQGRLQEARAIWIKARTLLDRKDPQHHWRIDRTTNSIIDSLCKDNNFAEAEQELSAFIDLPAFLKKASLDDNVVQTLLRNNIDTYMTLGKRSKLNEAVRNYTALIQSHFAGDGYLLYQFLRSITCTSLAWGVYDLAEETIRKMLRSLQMTADWDLEEEKEAYLCEALAFSLTLQNNPKRQDPYDCYMICTALHSKYYSRNCCAWQDGDFRSTRLKIGLARSCEATAAKHQEAALLYHSIAADSRGTTCSTWCIKHRQSAFFEGRACMLEGKLVDAILMFSQIISEFGMWVVCGCWASDYDNTVMAASSHLYLAELLDKCGSNSQASQIREQAVSELRSRFYEPFDQPGRSREKELSRLILRWSASALEDALALPSKIAPGDRLAAWKQFPFEAGWMLWEDCEDIDILLAVSKPCID